MAFNYFKDRLEKAEAEYQEKIRPEYKVLRDRPEMLTWEELPERMNSYEQEALYPRLDDRGLKLMTLKLMENITAYPEHHKHRPASTYEESLLRVMLPLILKRFAAMPDLLAALVAVADAADIGYAHICTPQERTSKEREDERMEVANAVRLARDAIALAARNEQED